MADLTEHSGKVKERPEEGLRRVLAGKDPVDFKIQNFAAFLSKFLEGAVVEVHLFDGEIGEFFLRGDSHRGRNGSALVRQGAAGTILGLSAEEKRTVSLGEERKPEGGGRRAETHYFPLFFEEEVFGVTAVRLVSTKGLSPVMIDRARRLVAEFASFLGELRRSDGISLKMTSISAINEAGVTLLSATSLPELYQMVTAISTLIMGSEGSILRLYDDESEKYTLRDAYGLRDQGRLREALKLERAAVGEVLAGAGPLLVKETASEEKYRPFAGTATTFICRPLGGGDEPLGALTLINKASGNVMTPLCFTGEDLENFGRLVPYVEKAISIARDRERREKERERDPVTGLPGARYFRERLLAEISRCQRFAGKLVLVSCAFTHAGGEKGEAGREIPGEALREMALTLRDTVREYDILARMDEGRFGIILPQAEDGSLSALSRIEAAVGRRIEELAATGLPVSPVVHFASAVFPDDGESGDELIQALAGGTKGKRRGGEWQDFDLVTGALRNKELFFGLSEEQLALVAGAAGIRAAKAGEFVFREGGPGDSIFIVHSGQIDIYKEQEEGRKVILASLEGGGVFGEMTLVSREPRSASAVVAKDSTLITLPHRELSEVFGKDSEIMALMALNIARILARRLRRTGRDYSNVYLSRIGGGEGGEPASAEGVGGAGGD